MRGVQRPHFSEMYGHGSPRPLVNFTIRGASSFVGQIDVAARWQGEPTKCICLAAVLLIMCWSNEPEAARAAQDCRSAARVSEL